MFFFRRKKTQSQIIHYITMVLQPPPSSARPTDNKNGYVKNRNLFKPAPEPVPLYYPTIFRYKCRGGFSISSVDAADTSNHQQGNRNNPTITNSRGYCRGIQTQLQHVRDLHKSTESESIQMFLQDYVPPSAAPPGIDGVGTASSSSSALSSSSSVPPISDVLETPAMIFSFQPKSNQKAATASKQKPTVHQHQHHHHHHDQKDHSTISDDNVVVGSNGTNTPTSSDSSSPSNFDDTHVPTTAVVNNNSNRNNDTTWHDWTAYGSTDVRVLVLRHTKTNEEKTVAVAPYTRLGASIREAGDTTSGEADTVTTVRVGPVEIVMRNHYWLEDEELEEQQERQKQQQQQQGRNTNNNSRNQSKDNQFTKPSSHSIFSNNNDAAAVDKNTSSNNNNNNHNPNRSISAMTFINGGKMVYEQSVKIGKAMQTNATILRDAVQEDFPQRCLDSSQRIVKEIGHTVHKTSDLMKSLYELWKDDDDE